MDDNLNEFANACTQLSAQCPTLRLISMAGIVVGSVDTWFVREEDHRSYWMALKELPKCCVVSVRAPPPGDLGNELHKFGHLEADDLVSKEAAKFGEHLKCYRYKEFSLSLAELAILGECRNLEELDVCLQLGVIGHVGDLLRRCRRVRRLKIAQEVDSTQSVRAGLVDIARQGCEVKEVKIQGILFGAQEWKDALKIFGGRLEKLETCYDELHGERIFDKRVDTLEAILESILECNRGLKYFAFGKIACPFELKSHGEDRMKYVRRLLRRVGRAIPLLNEGRLDEVFELEIVGGTCRLCGRPFGVNSFDCSAYSVSSACNDYEHVTNRVCAWPLNPPRRQAPYCEFRCPMCNGSGVKRGVNGRLFVCRKYPSYNSNGREGNLYY